MDYALDDFGYNTITFDGTKAKIKCATTEILPPAVMFGAKNIEVGGYGDEVRIIITYQNQDSASSAEEAVKRWCANIA